MKVAFPGVVKIEPHGIWMGRKNVGSVFVRKHNLQVNLDAVKAETKKVTDLTAKEWLFLVEGYKKYTCAENLFLDDFIDLLEIEAKDPIEPPFTVSVAQAASIEKLFAALSILTMDYLDFIEDKQIDQLEDEQLEAFFDLAVHTVAKAFEVSPKRLRKEFDRLKWNNERLLSEQTLGLAEKRRKLIDESNTLSKIKLVRILRENLQPNLFVMSGIEHATIFAQ